LKFSRAVGIGERMSWKEFGEIQDGCHKVGPIVFMLGKNIAKCKDILKLHANYIILQNGEGGVFKLSMFFKIISTLHVNHIVS
jgi:hypothetical protein